MYVLDLEIPIEFDVQGAKLATLTQAKAYRGIVTDWSLLLSMITMWTAFAKHDLLL